MKSETLFISDLHLDASRPDATSLFLKFLHQDACHSEALYILGDLFEVWVGDDDLSAHNRSVIDGLRELAATATPVFVMHGNRDFLMGEVFSRMAGITLLPDPSMINLYGNPTMLMHGDLLCSEDVQYLEFRKQVRGEEWQKDFLAKSLEQRREIATGLREESRRQTRHKPVEIMDVTQATVEDTMKAHHCQHLIHGHTHRPAIHEFHLEGKPARRIVLGDWYEQGSVLRCASGDCRLEKMPFHG